MRYETKALEPVILMVMSGMMLKPMEYEAAGQTWAGVPRFAHSGFPYSNNELAVQSSVDRTWISRREIDQRGRGCRSPHCAPPSVLLLQS